MIGDVSARLIETFAENLAEMLSNGGAPTPESVPEPGSAAATVPPVASAPAPRRASPAQSTLPVGKIAAGVIAGRLSNPRTLLAVTAVFVLAFLAIGFLIGRAT